MVQAMYEIFKDMVLKYLIIYIYKIIICADTYDEHVATLQKVLQLLLNEKFSLKASKWQFFIKCLDIIGYILTPDREHMDPKKPKQVLDFKVPNNCRGKQGIRSVVRFVNNFSP